MNILLSIINFILIVLFFYLVVYATYLFTLNLRSFKSGKYLKEIEEYNAQNTKERKLCVLVWATSKSRNIFDLLKILNSQTYAHSNYDVHAISICDGSANSQLPDFAHGARIHNIENSDFFSKNKALTVFVEKIIHEAEFDAFVFLSADRLISNDYLEQVNKNINNSCILTSDLSVLVNKTGFWNKFTSKILHSKQKFTNHTLNIARTMFELVSQIDGSNCVITTDILERTGQVCFENRDDELKYSLFLSSNEIKPVYCPFIKTWTTAKNYDMSSAHITEKINLLKYYMPLLAKKRWYFIEYVLSMLKPNALFATIAYCLLFYTSFRYSSSIDIKTVVLLGCFLLLNIITGAISSRLKISELFYLIFYPACTLILKYKLLAEKLTKRNIEKETKEEANINCATVNSIVSNGKKNLVCKIDLVSEDGMRKVVFRYNHKKYFSDAHLRMCDALNNITRKIEANGYTLKVCQNCKNFIPNNDGTIDLVKGYCKLRERAEGEYEQILIWNSCPDFQHSETDNIQ